MEVSRKTFWSDLQKRCRVQTEIENRETQRISCLNAQSGNTNLPNVIAAQDFRGKFMQVFVEIKNLVADLKNLYVKLIQRIYTLKGRY